MEAESVRGAVLGAYTQKLIRIKARQLIRTPWFERYEREDLQQELLLYVLKHIGKFNPDKAKLTTFISRIVDSHAAMLVRDRRRAKRAPGFFARSIETLQENVTEEPVSGAGVLADDDALRRLGLAAGDPQATRELRAAIARVIASLPSPLAEVCAGLVDGNVASVARELGISRRQVGNAIAELRRRFTAAGLDLTTGADTPDGHGIGSRVESQPGS